MFLLWIIIVGLIAGWATGKIMKGSGYGVLTDILLGIVGAIVIMQIGPERARQMREMQANFGKTWLMGKVTAINEVKVTLQGQDNVTHSFVADENTSFRKRREPITLADIQIGDMVRTEGTIRNGAFLATSVAVIVAPRQRDEDLAPPRN